MTKVRGGQGTPHLGEAKSQHPVGSGLSCKHESQAIPGSSFTPGTKETAKVETNKVMLIKTGLSEEPVCWFPKAFKEVVYFGFSGSPRGPG